MLHGSEPIVSSNSEVNTNVSCTHPIRKCLFRIHTKNNQYEFKGRNPELKLVTKKRHCTITKTDSKQIDGCIDIDRWVGGWMNG